ncbi:hypothetical protein NliqN6_3003 [Naganishia liquefaciens]|uniref:Uncharacterized protein n=1 Tax=Naganishia liquefaciens TaxID=104408 RepID=A0A8H3TTE5_9TREE|nr:hypothetical protein NliqN6_3003 [Naganishia liquefaciens]
MCGICEFNGYFCNGCELALSRGLRACEQCESYLLLAEAAMSPTPVVQTVPSILLQTPSLYYDPFVGAAGMEEDQTTDTASFVPQPAVHISTIANNFSQIAETPAPVVQTICPMLLHSPTLTENPFFDDNAVGINDDPTAIAYLAPTAIEISAGLNNPLCEKATSDRENKKQRNRDPDAMVFEAPEDLVPVEGGLKRKTLRRCEGHQGKTRSPAVIDACRTCRIRCATSQLRSELRRLRKGEERPVSKASPSSPRKNTNAKTVALHRRKENDLRALLTDGERGRQELIYHVGVVRVAEIEELLSQVPLPEGNWYST